jgi:membrane protein
MVVILTTFALLVLGNFLNEMLRESSPVAYRIIETFLDFRSVIAIIYLSLFFALAYKYIAARNIPFSRQIPGAILAGSGWIVYSLLFSLYLKYFSSYASLYGSMSVILIFMLWIHNCMLILLFGAEINMYLLRHIAVIKTKK